MALVSRSRESVALKSEIALASGPRPRIRGVDADAVTPPHCGATASLAAIVVNLPVGTLYAFSVFLKPMEALLGATRAQMGFVFGLATVSLKVGMNVAPQLYRRLSQVALALGGGLTRGMGLVLAAWAGVRQGSRLRVIR